MFQDIHTFTQLFDSAWPTTTITDSAAADGNLGSTWNYGATSTNTFGSGTANDMHSGGSGMFGVFGVTDTGYTNTDTGGITLCPGTAGSLLLRLNSYSFSGGSYFSDLQ